MAERPAEAGTTLLLEYFEKAPAARRGRDGPRDRLSHDTYGRRVPELVLDLLCHGTIEKGRDAAAGGVEYYDLGIDATALATVADSFAALQQRIEEEKKLGWSDLLRFLDFNWGGPDGEAARLLMKNSARYGSGAPSRMSGPGGSRTCSPAWWLKSRSEGAGG